MFLNDVTLVFPIQKAGSQSLQNFKRAIDCGSTVCLKINNAFAQWFFYNLKRYMFEMNVFYVKIGNSLTLFQYITILSSFENADFAVTVTFDSFVFHSRCTIWTKYLKEDREIQ